jgi:LPS export ABC transporter protein LptC
VTTKEQRVRTDQPVTIQDPRGIIRGQGLEFDNNAKTLRLDSQVSGTFQPRDVPK